MTVMRDVDLLKFFACFYCIIIIYDCIVYTVRPRKNETENYRCFIITFFRSFFLTEVSYERAETQLSRNVIFSLKFRYRPPNDFLVSSLQIHLINHSCVKYASYELHQMKEEDLSFTNMCHLLFIIVIKL